jgi:hypothetical protein
VTQKPNPRAAAKAALDANSNNFFEIMAAPLGTGRNMLYTIDGVF